jgi:hypothetical protein
MTKEELQILEAIIISFKEYREAADAEIKSLKETAARTARANEANRPFMCSNISCKNRERVVTCPHCGAVIK